jgi:hypothetical protein
MFRGPVIVGQKSLQKSKPYTTRVLDTKMVTTLQPSSGMGQLGNTTKK